MEISYAGKTFIKPPMLGKFQYGSPQVNIYSDSTDPRGMGFHPVDGARHLVAVGVPAAVVELVAFHTGASFEADERGLGDELHAFSEPPSKELDLLTMCDLAVSPKGELIVDERRVVANVAYLVDDKLLDLGGRPDLDLQFFQPRFWAFMQT